MSRPRKKLLIAFASFFALIALFLTFEHFRGVWMLKRVPHDAFYRIAYVLMLTLGVLLVRSAVGDLGWI